MTTDDRMSSLQFQCILQCGKACRASDSMDNIASAAWDKIKCKALNWKGLGTFGKNVYDSVDWELGPRGKHIHSNCRVDISSSEKLSRSKTIQHKRDRKSPSPDETSDTNCDPTKSSTAPKRDDYILPGMQ